MKCCPACGQTLPREAVIRDASLSPLQSSIFRAVEKAGSHGIHRDRLFQHLYGDRADGGPDSGVRCIQVHIFQLNKRLAKIGKRVCQAGGKYTRPGDGTFYVIEDVS